MAGSTNTTGEAKRLLTEAASARREAIELRDRLRVAWATVEGQQRRAAAEWAEANRYFADQTAALTARAAELASREKALSEARAAAEAETAGLREEAAALERRIQAARATLAELEVRRDRVRTELSGTAVPPALPPAAEPGDLEYQARLLAREKAAVATLKVSLAREGADLDDRRRVLAEQLSLLTDARARWQQAERQTVAELEGLAAELWRREQELDARERRLVRADVRRRQESHDLWRMRLRLEAWQSKLAAAEVRSGATPAAELTALRAEFDRLAAVLIEVEPPEESRPDVLPFDPGSRAA